MTDRVVRGKVYGGRSVISKRHPGEPFPARRRRKRLFIGILVPVVTALLVAGMLFAAERFSIEGESDPESLPRGEATPEEPAEALRGPRVHLEVGSDFQQAVDASPPDTRFVIASGVHRLQKVSPKNGMIFTGETGAVLSGAKVLGSFATEGDMWVAAGQSQQGHRFSCTYPCVDPGYERDNYPEDLFVDGVRLRHVASKDAVKPRTWFFDYDADKIYLADDPAGKLVETSVPDHAFYGNASGVVIDNLTVRHYANPSHTGAIHARDTRNWTIRRVDASHNHAMGIHLGPGTHVHNSRTTYNGQLGIGGGTSGAAATIEHNEIAYNTQLHYNMAWETGGLKTANGVGTVVANNWVHHNDGVGIWFDVYARNTTIRSNLVEHNVRAGIFYEISYGPTEIAWNTVRHNGKGLFGEAGIRILNSRNVQVFGNGVDSNEWGILLQMKNGRGSGPDGRLELANVEVRNNDIRMLTGATGLVDETGNDAYYTSKGNVFEGNTYRLDDVSDQRFTWTGGWSGRDWAEWQGFGNDTSQDLANISSRPSLPSEAARFEDMPYGPIHE
jgi:hypothetical protein